MSVTRQGIVASAVAIMIALAAGTVAFAISTQTAMRRVEVAERAARIQGREWSLGAADIAPGIHVVCGAWDISKNDLGVRIAHGPRGTFFLEKDGRERWISAQSPR